jgi:hypothetical protein
MQPTLSLISVFVALLLAPLAALPAADAAHAGAKPNIILALADDLGWGDPGFNGNKVIQTPHLDAMAQASLRFERFYSGAPVCSPTRGSCLTGRHPYRYGIWSANEGHAGRNHVGRARTFDRWMRRVKERSGVCTIRIDAPHNATDSRDLRTD